MSLKSEEPGVQGTSRFLRVLLVEDSQIDALLLRRALERGGFRVEAERVDTQPAMEKALTEKTWDLVLADHAMPSFSAPEALELVKSHGLDVPFIIVSGFIEEETAVAAMRSGAHDYVMKDRLARLVPAVERELREAQVRRAKEAYAEELRRAREELEVRVEKRTADLKAANQKLHTLLEERRRLENELLEIAENERRSIGFDLHDDLGQKLTGTSMMLKGLERKLFNEQHPCAADAGRIQQVLEDIIHHTHNLAHQFSALDLHGDELSSVLRDLAGNVKNMFGIACNFTIKGALPELPGNTLLQLHKITQEAVSNAIKHGKAKSVSISVHNEPGNLTLTVRNDGVPFVVPPGKKNRMGLRIMKYRASTIGAELEIEAQDGGGTVLACRLPVARNSKRNRAPADDNSHETPDPEPAAIAAAKA